MAKQGKCVKCKKRYEWEKEIYLRECNCWLCGSPLAPTTHLLKWPVVKCTPMSRSNAVMDFGFNAAMGI